MEPLVAVIGAVLLLYLCPLVVLTSPILLVSRRRRMLAPREMTVAAYPALVWVVLLATSSHVWKGLTNVDVELVALAIGVAVAVYVRVCLRRISGSRYRALFLPVAACLLRGCDLRRHPADAPLRPHWRSTLRPSASGAAATDA